MLDRCYLMLPLLLTTVACDSQDAPSPSDPPTPDGTVIRDPRSGQTRMRVGVGEDAVHLQSGVTLPVELPDGITVFPGASVTSHSRVLRGGRVRTLIAFTTPQPLPEVILFYRQQVKEADIALAVDLTSQDRASLAGKGPELDFALALRRSGGLTRAELAVGPASQLASPVAED